jgi:hypothetical protein
LIPGLYLSAPIFLPIPCSDSGWSERERSAVSYCPLEPAKDFSHHLHVLDLVTLQNLLLRGGFVVAEVRLASQFLLDPLGRPAAAQTIIRGTRLHIFLRDDLDEAELSVSLYHEVLEAVTVAAEHPPDAVIEFNEGDFEHAAQSAHARLGIASPRTLNQMLADFGF